MFLRRLGPTTKSGNSCIGAKHCPDLFELEDGDFAVIGADITSAADKLPPDAGCGPGERIVRLPRQILVLARADIPSTL